MHDVLVLMEAKTTITRMRKNYNLHRWLLPFNGLQDGTPYAGRPIGNFLKFTPLDHSLNRYILHSLHFHCVLSRFVLKGKGNDEEGKQMIFSYATPREIASGIKRI